MSWAEILGLVFCILFTSFGIADLVTPAPPLFFLPFFDTCTCACLLPQILMSRKVNIDERMESWNKWVESRGEYNGLSLDACNCCPCCSYVILPALVGRSFR
ncbi:hypothetical protein GGR55DRAFT_503258 [Xylaria sp. FL0064]|nr:hypothetical protein GGR55DRAFT_503258 [Xylaria sp. FL0064]